MSVLLVSPSWGQAEVIRHDDWVTLRPYAEARELQSDEPADEVDVLPPVHTSICLDLPRYPHQLVESSDSFVRQITPTHIPSGSLLINYEGLHRFVVKRLQGKFRSYWRKQMRMLYRDTYLGPFELGDIQGRMNEAWGDMATVGNWWDRTMWESLPPEKGGAPKVPYVHTYGREFAIFEWGPLTINNTLKARVSSVELLSLEDSGRFVYRTFHQGGTVARDDARLERDVLDPLDDESEPGPRDKVGELTVTSITRVQFNFAPEVRRQLWENVSWRFKARPSIRLAPSLDYLEVVREVSMKAEFDILYGAKRTQVVGIEASAQYVPASNEFEFTFQIAMLNW